MLAGTQEGRDENLGELVCFIPKGQAELEFNPSQYSLRDLCQVTSPVFLSPDARWFNEYLSGEVVSINCKCLVRCLECGDR